MTVLIVEDGTGVADANSYISLADARSFAETRSLELPADDNEAILALIQGFDYVESFRSLYGGVKAMCPQGTQFPRVGLKIDGCPVPETQIPYEVRQAQVIAASVHSSGVDLVADADGKEVASERVEGAVQVSYFQTGNVTAQPYFRSIQRLLEPLFGTSSSGLGAPGILLGRRV